MLLALCDERGTALKGNTAFAVAGAIMTELILQRRISVGKSKRQIVTVLNRKSTGNEILDEVTEKIVAAKKNQTSDRVDFQACDVAEITSSGGGGAVREENSPQSGGVSAMDVFSTGLSGNRSEI